MTTYPNIFEFTPRGLVAFKKAFSGELPEDAFDPTDKQFALPVPQTKSISDEPADTAGKLAARILHSLNNDWTAYLEREGIWAWLAFVLRDQLYPVGKDKIRKTGEYWRWYPSDPGNYQKAQRHLVRMPVVLRASLGNASDHLLCGKPDILPDVREQCVGQQDMLTENFQRAARTLYFDDEKKSVKRGAGSKGPGSPRRLRDLRSQLDVTWNIFDLDSDEILALLPKEFDRFKPKEANA